MVTKVGDNYELVGATSWGRGCAWSSFPGVYADIRRILIKFMVHLLLPVEKL